MDALNITPPKLFAGGPVTGILFSMPFLLFALTPFFSKNKAENNTEDKLEAGRFILYLLGGSFLISFVSILVYFYEQTRFTLDMISQITLLAVIGYWMVLSNPRSSKVLLRAANVLITITIAASILLSFTSEGNRMEKLNPALMEKINSFFILQK
jgi:cytochrome c oxidase assembly factor CtaG